MTRPKLFIYILLDNIKKMMSSNYTYFIPEDLRGQTITLNIGETYTTLGILISSVLLSSGAFINSIIEAVHKYRHSRPAV